MLSQHLSGLTHHAYLIEGGAEMRALIETELHAHDVVTVGNPDYFAREVDVFTIDDAHLLTRYTTRTPVGERKIVLVIAGIMTNEAQQALLKTIEEPAPQTHIIVVVPGVSELLPTVRSRMRVLVPQAPDMHEDVVHQASAFLHGTLLARMTIAQKLTAAKDITAARQFVDACLTVAHAAGDYAALRIIAYTRQYLTARGPSLKLLLENFAIQLPQAPHEAR